MAQLKVAINGFGRIGRITYRILQSNRNVEVVAINDLTDNTTLAHLLKYDTAHGSFDAKITAGDDFIKVNSKKITALSERDPSKLPWKKMKVDVVLECTGVFRDTKGASLHLKAGAKKVVISAPAKDADIKTVVLGINDDTIKKSDKILSNASCTTNCLAPAAKVLDDAFGIEHGFINTIHAYTADQNLQDAPHSDLRRARAAAQNIVPTSTGAAKAVGLVLPHLNGKLNGIAMRVPTITGSAVDFTCVLKKNVTKEKVNAAFKKAAAKGNLKGYLQYTEEPIVSSDVIGCSYSSIFDAGMTDVIGGNLVKIVTWYDNEAGYSNRMADLVVKMKDF